MDNLDELLKAHYEKNRLPDPKVDEILHSCADARLPHRWKRIAIGAISVAAASLVALGVTLVSVERKDSNSLAMGAEVARIPHKLVAVRIHADRCARSKVMAPIFANLQQEFAGEPVLFVTFDRSSECAAEQTACLSRILGIESIFKEFRKTGAIVVASPDGVVRDIVSAEGGLLAATQTVRHNLDATLLGGARR